MASIALPLPQVSIDDRTFFGHPKSLAYLAFTEAWERFSFYGMSALLLLYMIQRLLTPEVMGGVLGLSLFRAGLEGMTGPLSNRAFASQLFGLYSGLVYFTPMFGGLVGDRLLGQRRTVMLACRELIEGAAFVAVTAAIYAAQSYRGRSTTGVPTDRYGEGVA